MSGRPEFCEAGAWYAAHTAPQHARLDRQAQMAARVLELQHRLRGVSLQRTQQAQRMIGHDLQQAVTASTQGRIQRSLLQPAWRRWWGLPLLLSLGAALPDLAPRAPLPPWGLVGGVLALLALWTWRPQWAGLSSLGLGVPRLAGFAAVGLGGLLAAWLGPERALLAALPLLWTMAVVAAGGLRALSRHHELRPGPVRWLDGRPRGVEVSLVAPGGHPVPLFALTPERCQLVAPAHDPVVAALAAWLNTPVGTPVRARLQSQAHASVPDAEVQLLEHLDATMRQQAARVAAAQEALEQATRELRGLWLPRPVLEGLMGGLALFRDGRPGAPTGTLLVGPPGTGKTEAARRLALAAQVAVRTVDASALKAGHVGGTEAKVRELWDEVRALAPCILIVDECDAVFADRGRPDTDTFARSMTEGFLAAWQPTQANAPRVWVIGATNYRDRIDPAMLSRLGQVLDVPLPDWDARDGLLRDALTSNELAPTIASPDLIDRLQGFSGRDIATFAQTLALQQHGGSGRVDPLALADQWRRRQGLTAAGTGRADRSAWERVILPPAVKTRLWTLTQALREAEALRARGFELPLGVLLAGPPGTGKTETARALATAAGVGFVAGSLASVKGSYVGHSSAQTRQLFARARSSAPTILFLDELDAMAPTRGTGDQYTDEIVAQMLVELDGIVSTTSTPVLLVGATNHPQRIDPAIRSRLGEVLTIPLPDAATRAAILRVMLQDAGGTLAPEVLDATVPLTANLDGWSGRDLRTALRDAQQGALTRALEHGDVRNATLELADLERVLVPR